MSDDENTPDVAELLKEIRASQKKLSDEFAQFRSEEDAAAKALRKVRREKPYAYRRKGNEEQASFNEKVEDSIVAAQMELEGATPPTSGALDRAKKSLKEGLALLCERQKLIKLADRSEHGWGVVAEYTADELAEDSDDEKRIFKAEKAAERKAAKRRKTMPPRPRSRVQGSMVDAAPAVGLHQAQQVVPGRPATMPQSYAQAVRPARPLGPCFSCGEPGHIRSCCPKVSDGRKWYP